MRVAQIPSVIGRANNSRVISDRYKSRSVVLLKSGLSRQPRCMQLLPGWLDAADKREPMSPAMLMPLVVMIGLGIAKALYERAGIRAGNSPLAVLLGGALG